ncbi:DUF4198 domain-containing protein [Aggregatibacter actinomycetemcomitans]|uniref:DUF4198 domain-containing protein n=1 Tax=Aggregatibacter actinomycetemcomitans TaxID=714 RepID=UPI00197B3492|nr:DUF4198 domain-containing protein [Aggregatibacter actinomycetemcomitans]MBN6082343.1 DUF4198 domain-containing protein [Aggregatibacter actinomycetemcomitans]
MKKSLLITLLGLSSLTQAHDLWVTAPSHISAEDILKADLGYGHHFPYAEKIADDRLHFFAPLELTDKNGNTTELKQQGENYQYTAEKPLAEGSYWVSATYKPIFWSQNAKGWRQENMQQMKDATYCEQTQMFGKSLVTVGGKIDSTIYKEKLGQELEIVPLKSPAELKAGEVFPLQIFYKGKPLAGEAVIATADTVLVKDIESAEDHREVQGFSSKTDKDGKVNFLPLVEGLWKVKVIHKIPLSDPKVCQHSANYATLVLPVGEKRAEYKPHEHHHHH